MELVLTVIAAPPQSPLLGQTQTLQAAGASFGRGGDNSWVLPDPDRVVSSRHATLAFQNGRYMLIDHSTNGTFVNGSATPVGQGNSLALNSGDILAMGPFQLQVILRAPPPAPMQLADLGGSFLDELAPAPSRAAAPAPAAQAPGSGGFDDLDRWLEPAAPAAPVQPAWAPSPVAAHAPLPLGDAQETDPLALLGGDRVQDNWLAGGGDSDDWWQTAPTQSDHAPADQHQMRIPQPQPSPEAVNIDDLLGLAPNPAPAAPPTDITAPRTQRPAAPVQAAPPQAVPTQVAPTPVATAPAAPMPTPAPPPAAAQPAASDELAQQLAARLGLDRLAPADLERLVDEVAGSLRETAARLIEILRARSSIKNELRLDRTMLGASENNPLKFSVRGEDALAYMFEDRGGAFLRAEAAIRDSFDDLADHQVAVLAGMRAAYQSMLAEFEPDKLEQRFGPGGGLMSNRKARLWEAYQEYYARLSADSENAYTRLFGEIFARAYETQINELKAARRFGVPR